MVRRSKGRVSKRRVSKRRVSKRRVSKRRVSKRRVSKRRVSKRYSKKKQRGGVLPLDLELVKKGVRVIHADGRRGEIIEVNELIFRHKKKVRVGWKKDKHWRTGWPDDKTEWVDLKELSFAKGGKQATGSLSSQEKEVKKGVLKPKEGSAKKMEGWGVAHSQRGREASARRDEIDKLQASIAKADKAVKLKENVALLRKGATMAGVLAIWRPNPDPERIKTLKEGPQEQDQEIVDECVRFLKRFKRKMYLEPDLDDPIFGEAFRFIKNILIKPNTIVILKEMAEELSMPDWDSNLEATDSFSVEEIQSATRFRSELDGIEFGTEPQLKKAPAKVSRRQLQVADVDEQIAATRALLAKIAEKKLLREKKKLLAKLAKADHPWSVFEGASPELRADEEVERVATNLELSSLGTSPKALQSDIDKLQAEIEAERAALES